MDTPALRLQAARKNAGFTSAADAIDRFGWKQSTYMAHENGQNGIRPKVADSYAKAYGVRADWLLMIGAASNSNGEASEVVLNNSDLVPTPVVGVTEAGSFREQSEFVEFERVTIFEPRDQKFPNARQVAFDVEGDSMNDLKPFPIVHGQRVIGIDFEDLDNRVPLRDGMVVVVEQLRDGGHLREWSVKQIELYDDRIEFCPRSTNPRHKPIVVPRDLKADDGRMVRVMSLVRRITNEVPL